MTPEQFTYWLQGFVELSGIGDEIDSRKWVSIKDHLQTVFNKETPTYTKYPPNVTTTPTQLAPPGSGTYFPTNAPTVIC